MGSHGVRQLWIAAVAPYDGVGTVLAKVPGWLDACLSSSNMLTLEQIAALKRAGRRCNGIRVLSAPHQSNGDSRQHREPPDFLKIMGEAGFGRKDRQRRVAGHDQALSVETKLSASDRLSS